MAYAWAMIRRVFQVALYIMFIGGCLFVPAGRWDWTAAWVYLGFWVICVLVAAAVMLRVHPDLPAERGRGLKDAPAWDKVLVMVSAAYGPQITMVVAGLDVRFGWTTEMPVAVRVASLLVAIAGFSLTLWAIVANRFFSSIARIQTDRGHHPVTDGPYSEIRHPGYVGMIAIFGATPLILGSWWAALPGAVTVAATVIRTALEDRMLRAELEGYADYADLVRYRLVPGVW